MKGPTDFVESHIVFSNPVQSRKSKHLKYVYVSHEKTDGGSSISIESPKLAVDQHCNNSDRSDISVLQIHLENQYNEPVIELIEVLKRINKHLKDHFIEHINNGYTAYMDADVWKLKIIHAGNHRTLFYSESDKKELDDLALIKPPALTSSLVRMIADLDGVIIDDKSKSIRPVWSIDQVLLYSENPVNPFGKKYCFIDDDDNYMSLDDE